MKELIENIDNDIKRCENNLKENDFLEMVIIIEELYDKYKNNIKFINTIPKDVVWKYSKKDLEIINDNLNIYKKMVLSQYKRNDFNFKTNQLKNKIININIKNKYDLLKIIEELESLIDKDITLDEKWNEVKKHIAYIQYQERSIAVDFLELINYIIKD